MKKALLLFIIVFAMFLTVSCAENSNDAPEGLQVIDNSTEGGYIFYAPVGWNAVNSNNVSAL